MPNNVIDGVILSNRARTEQALSLTMIIKEDVEGLRDEVLIIKGDTYNIYEDTIVIKDQAREFRDQAQTAARLTVRGIQVLGRLPSTDWLPDDPKEGDAYVIEVDDEDTIYVYANGIWESFNIGEGTEWGQIDGDILDQNDLKLLIDSLENQIAQKADTTALDNLRSEIALPVPAIPELLVTDTDLYTKALVSGYYEEGDTEKAVVWEWDADKPKADHDGWSCLNPAHLADLGSPEWFDPVGDGTDDEENGVWVRKNKKALTVFDFGARDEEDYDNTHHFQIMADSLGYVAIPDSENPFEINGLTTTRQTRIFSSGDNARIKVLGISRNDCVWLRHSGSSIRGVHFYGNNTNKSLVRVTADDCDVYMTGENVTADEDAPNASISGLHIIANRTRFQIRAWNFANTGYSNESTPRVVTVEGESNEFEGSIYGDKVCTGIVTGGDVIYGRLHRVELSEASDNGVYQLGTTSKLSIGTVVYRGSEEGLVIGGNGCEIDSYKIVGRSSAAISMQSGALKITDMRIEGNPEIGSPASILSLRPGYTAKKIEIGNITGTIWGNTLMNMSPGACRSFRLLSADLEFLYTDDRAGAITQWWNLDNAEEIFIQNAKVVIRDIEGDLAGSGSIFEVRLGSQGGAGNKVTLINPEIYIRNNDGGSVPGNSVRIVRLNRGNFSIQGVKIFTNLSHMVGREANYLGPFVAGVNISNNKPTGTFPIGTTVYRGDGASSPYGWVYTQDGWEDLTIP